MANADNRHSLLEDLQAIFIASLLIAFALNLFAQQHMLTGGTAGLALLGHYQFGLSMGLCTFLANLPFYYLGFRQMGLAFVIRTFAAVTAVSLFTELIARLVLFQSVAPLFAVVFGGCLIGVGFILLFRHGASLGGFGVLALYCQKRYGVSAGKVQLAIDGLILLTGFLFTPWPAAVYSLLGAVLINLILILNHKGSRYIGYSAGERR
ncbi:YitT family protein [Ectopseudomonas oleovorans]|uniref:YitT family protein n=1 Tax=Ectopseudomonas oleovorans TaxID=301 RepID=A0AA42QBA6_ECTOL|nr:YitT family protein [Pseudomonas oleovorans]MDH1339291.1 YitT family protein [Pseudomonas oleovorans]MDH1492571.1 YitT family protein [Pseudomonas oleovorans]WGG21181.1 YitT family protein [Pseudomonas oleovorans]